MGKKNRQKKRGSVPGKQEQEKPAEEVNGLGSLESNTQLENLSSNNEEKSEVSFDLKAAASHSSSAVKKRKYPDICSDLFLPLVSSTKKKGLNAEEAQSSQLIQRQILLHRLDSTGYTHAAVAHTVYGAPHLEDDRADEHLLLDHDKTIQKQKSIQTLRRLHVVVENLSDVGLFVKPSQSLDTLDNKSKQFHNLLSEYDLISMAPGNEVSFQAICRTATASEIIVLDYTMKSGGSYSLPYRLRAADIRAAIARNAVFELSYAPAILNPKLRRKLIQCCREFQIASAGQKPRLVFSSGVRTFQDIDGNTVEDAADMALRTPCDMKNLIITVLNFDDKMASQVFSSHADFAIQRGLERRFGNSIIRNVNYESQDLTESSKTMKADEATNCNTNSTTFDAKRNPVPSTSLQVVEKQLDKSADIGMEGYNSQNKANESSDEYERGDAEGDGFIAF
mmetsp:Transcript_5564/g.7320  ORF Transcript_5564/g.7320 Transcript_5564/m.7320 type:complete len:451 (+) Transcript_5564:331-1683(+)|eukprot:CAMPEP_0198153488 /NCGR_PEP_ID=MMETSP1443-20131203/64421_1 /TAXON_ID=186043 /ORGANISM="Entomoneis sp., Strain CCMP2396" /LENGTH=450 /DNA_ID=CAMNT_0043819843 /DNA_START=325 /DNA_END=1677 /DNA_ORIENTATION=+